MNWLKYLTILPYIGSLVEKYLNKPQAPAPTPTQAHDAEKAWEDVKRQLGK